VEYAMSQSQGGFEDFGKSKESRQIFLDLNAFAVIHWQLADCDELTGRAAWLRCRRCAVD
jgi:hypothetical protein